jgi:hypothetical protein
MDTTYLRMARRLWNVDYIPYWENRANQRKWIRSLRLLGGNWLLKDKTSRLEESKNVTH